MSPMELERAEYQAEVRKLYLEGATIEHISQVTQRHPSATKKLIQRFERRIEKQERVDVEKLRGIHKERLLSLLGRYYKATDDPDNLVPGLNGIRATLKDLCLLEGTATPVTQVIEQDVTVSGNMLLAAKAPSTGLPSQSRVIEHES